MIKSMTGYGKAEATLQGGKITVELRSLNGKNADITIKSPLLPKEHEMAVRKMVADRLQRGSIDMFISWEPNAAESAKTINRELALEYWSQIKALGDELGAAGLQHDNPNELIYTLMRMPDVIDSRKQDVITEDNWPLVEKAISEAIDALDAFRVREGAVLEADVRAKVAKIMECSHAIEPYEKERSESVREKILARFEELKLEPDQSRLEQEMIFYLEKLDINEERVRLRQHCTYYLETLETENPGKKLGFIAQEMGREINTTGSKANHTEIQRLVTSMKDELEKIKEQSLNIL